MNAISVFVQRAGKLLGFVSPHQPSFIPFTDNGLQRLGHERYVSVSYPPRAASHLKSLADSPATVTPQACNEPA